MIARNAVYQGLSFDEMVKPLMIYKQEKDRLEDSFDNLAMQAEAFRNSANQEMNPKAYGIYSNYMNDLNDAVGSLSNGDLIMAKRKLSELKKRYPSEIGAISEAKRTLDSTYDYADRLRMKDNSIRMKSSYNLDDFLKGGHPDNDYISGNDLEKQVAYDASQVAKTIFNDPETSNVAMGQISVKLQRGFSPDDIFEFMSSEDSVLYPELSKIIGKVDEALQGYSEEDKKYLKKKAMNGLMAGIIEPTQRFMKDYGDLQNSRYGSGSRNGSSKNTPYTKSSLFSINSDGAIKEYDIKNEEGNVDLEDGKLVYANGETKVNENDFQLSNQQILLIKQAIGKISDDDDYEIYAYKKRKGNNSKPSFVLEVRYRGNNLSSKHESQSQQQQQIISDWTQD